MMINMGNGNFVSAEDVVFVQDAAPIKNARKLRELSEKDNCFDFSGSKKTRSIITLSNGMHLLCVLTAQTVADRVNRAKEETTSAREEQAGASTPKNRALTQLAETYEDDVDEYDREYDDEYDDEYDE